VAAHVRQWGWHFATEFCWERNGIPKHVSLRFKNQFEPVYQFARNRWKVYPDNVAHRSDHAIVSLGPGSGATTWTDRQGSGRNLIDSNRRLRRSTLTPGALSNFQGQPAEGERIRGEYQRRRHGHTGYMSGVQGSNKEPGEYLGEGWAFPGNRLPPFSGDHEATGHAAAFPVGLPQWFVLAFTDSWDHVLDPFAGSGSTLLACVRANRTSFNIEISPKYCDVICRRFQVATGHLPILDATGEEFDFLADVTPEGAA
jgi:DNA methylase